MGVGPIDGDAVATVDGDARGDQGERAGERDRARRRGGEIDAVRTAAEIVGIQDRLAKRAGAGIGRVGDREGGGFQ